MLALVWIIAGSLALVLIVPAVVLTYLSLDKPTFPWRHHLPYRQRAGLPDLAAHGRPDAGHVLSEQQNHEASPHVESPLR